ncbi:hypothetical protein ES707_08453 [subsurface metagenome]
MLMYTMSLQTISSINACLYLAPTRKLDGRGLPVLTKKEIEEQIEKLESSEIWQEKREAIMALEYAEVCDPIIIQPLIVTAQKGKHRILRRTAVRLLGKIGDPKAVEPLIIVLLKNQTSDVRGAAAQALGQIGDTRAVEPLIAILEDLEEETYVRENAIEALGKIANNRALEALVATLKDDGISKKVFMTLTQVGESAVETLISAFGNESTEMREKIACIMGKIGDNKAVEPLIIAALRDNDYAVRVWSVTALGNIGDARAVEPLVRLLCCKGLPIRIRGHAAEALGKIGDDSAIEPLIKVLEDQREEWFVKDRGAYALLQLDENKTALPLLRYLKQDPDIKVRFKPLEHGD